MPPFFVLSSEYNRAVLDEIYYLVKYANFTHSDLWMMPTFERRYFLDKLIKETDKRNEQIQKINNKNR